MDVLQHKNIQMKAVDIGSISSITNDYINKSIWERFYIPIYLWTLLSLLCIADIPENCLQLELVL